MPSRFRYLATLALLLIAGTAWAEYCQSQGPSRSATTAPGSVSATRHQTSAAIRAQHTTPVGAAA